MFERMTEDARRIIFFSRNAAARLGGESIGPEHLLLGLLEEDPGVVEELLSPGDSVQVIRQEIENRHDWGATKLPRNVEMPVDDACRRIFARTAREADRLWQHEINTRHFLIALLAEKESLASQVLRDHGLEVSAARSKLFDRPVPSSPGTRPTGGTLLQSSRPVVPDEETAIRIAEAVLTPILGHEAVESQRPFHAELGHFAMGVDPLPAEAQALSHVPPPGPYWMVRGNVSGERGDPLTVQIAQRTGRIFFPKFGRPSH